MESLIQQIKEHVKSLFLNVEGSHDWQHIERVWKMAVHLQKKEGGDRLLVELAALLHDISDHKYNGGNFELGAETAKSVLLSFGASTDLADKVAVLVSKISFKGAQVQDIQGSIELAIVRDADRLDAIGAIGIARAFAFGGSINSPLYVPDMEPTMHRSKEEYLLNRSHTINHFHEKLFLLKDRMETNSAKDIALHRHAVMKHFIQEFMTEWDMA